MDFDFKLKKTGLIVELVIKSTDSLVSFVIGYGDNTPDSNIPNPVEPYEYNHTYTESDFYTISIAANFEDPDNAGQEITISKTITVGLSDGNFIPLDKTLNQLITTFITPGTTIEDDMSYVPDLILKWQLFLFPLVNEELEEVYYNNELYWPPLVNYLIAQLVAYDLIFVAANRYLISLGVSEGTSGGGEIKSIKTGPSEAEWYQGSETWSKVFANGGPFDQLKGQICNLAQRLRITLEICRNLDHNTIVPSVHRKIKR